MDSNYEQGYTFRGLLIALCMGLYDYRYLWVGNLPDRMFVIHKCANYIQTNAPILNAAKHCALYWSIFLLDHQLPYTFDELKKATYYEDE